MKHRIGGAKDAVADAKNMAKSHVSGKARPDGTAHDGDPTPHPPTHPAHPSPSPHDYNPHLHPIAAPPSPHRARLLTPHAWSR